MYAIDEECPLNDIIISDNELPGLLPQYSYIKTIESLTDSIKYISNNKTNNSIISNLELSGNRPCIAGNEHNWISVNEYENEKMCNCETEINGILYDPLYKEVGNKILIHKLLIYMQEIITI